jgi:hypothetical protein
MAYTPRYYPRYDTYIFLKRFPVQTQEEYRTFIREWKSIINQWTRYINTRKRVFKEYQREVSSGIRNPSLITYSGLYENNKKEYAAYVTLIHYLRTEKLRDYHHGLNKRSEKICN